MPVLENIQRPESSDRWYNRHPNSYAVINGEPLTTAQTPEVTLRFAEIYRLPGIDPSSLRQVIIYGGSLRLSPVSTGDQVGSMYFDTQDPKTKKISTFTLQIFEDSRVSIQPSTTNTEPSPLPERIGLGASLETMLEGNREIPVLTFIGSSQTENPLTTQPPRGPVHLLRPGSSMDPRTLHQFHADAARRQRQLED